MRRMSAAVAGVLLAAITISGQTAGDLATIGRIRDEAIQRSQVMDHLFWLSEVHGPRVTGTPAFAAASEWAMERFSAWGLANVHQERFAFGTGWVIERFSAHLIEPQPQVIVGAPRGWSPSTPGPVTAEVVRVQARTEADLARYVGKLRGRIVITQPARAVRMLDGRIVLRYTDDEFDEAAQTPVPQPDAPGGPRVETKGPAAPLTPVRLAAFLVAEGAAALLDRGSDRDVSAGGSDLSWETQRVDGGTVFPTSGGSRDPKAPTQVPSATIAVEHYNRIVRLLDRGVPVTMELNIQTRFHPETGQPGGINTLAEIPGSDLAHEVVILGAHMDGVPYATGSTDNATGTSTMMEAVRIIKALGLQPRRTIRVALWAGEEQGLLGSRAYVREHYFDAETKAPKPGYESLAAYFNLDNGTGRIRGIWGQANLAALPVFERWGAPLRDLGWRMVSPRVVGATDHAAFDQVGLPGFQFMQERLEYNSRSHHSTMDTFDRVQRDDLIQQATVAAVFAWQAANAPEKLPRRAVAMPAAAR